MEHFFMIEHKQTAQETPQLTVSFICFMFP